MGSGNEIELGEDFILNDGVNALDVRPAGIYVIFLGNMLPRITLSLGTKILFSCPQIFDKIARK